MVKAAVGRRRGRRPDRAGDRRRGQGRRAGSRTSPKASKNRPRAKILVLNKVDIAEEGRLLRPRRDARRTAEAGQRYSWFPRRPAMACPDTQGTRWPPRVPEGPWLFPEDQVSDVDRPHGRRRAAPASSSIISSTRSCPIRARSRPRSGKDRKDGSTVIHQQILVERDSQKAIVVGRAVALYSLGQAAREEIAQHLGRKVHLFLHVKVNPRWDEDRGLRRRSSRARMRLGLRTKSADRPTHSRHFDACPAAHSAVHVEI